MPWGTKRSNNLYWNGDVHWFSIKDVPSQSDVFVVSTEEKITELGVNKSSTKILPIGTTIITARGTVGKLALVGTPMAMNQSCYGIRGIRDNSDYFTFSLLKSAIEQLKRNTHGAVFDTITNTTFSTIRICVSPQSLISSFEKIVKLLMEKIKPNVNESISLQKTRGTLLPKLLSGELDISELNLELQ